jgi:hypothetical protein
VLTQSDSPAIRTAGHRLYQFVLARMLESVPTTPADVEQYLAALDAPAADGIYICRAAEREADYWSHEAPTDMEDDAGRNLAYSAAYASCLIMEAELALIDRHGAELDACITALEAQLA